MYTGIKTDDMPYLLYTDKDAIAGLLKLGSRGVHDSALYKCTFTYLLTVLSLIEHSYSLINDMRSGVFECGD